MPGRPVHTPQLRASPRDWRFACLLAGETVNSVGSWASAIALWGAGAYRFDVGPEALSLLIACWAAPPILLAPFVGVVVDRLGPRRSLVIAYLGGALTVLGLAWAGSLLELEILAVLAGAPRALGGPAGASLPPELVAPDDLVAANGWLGATTQLGQVLGPLTASVAFALAGFRSAFLLDAATYLVGVGALGILPAVAARPRQRVPFGRELTEGLRVVGRRPLIQLVLLVAAAQAFTSTAFLVVEPLYAREVLGRPPSQFALFEAAAGLGAVAGSLAATRLRGRLLHLRWVGAAAIAYGLAAALFIGTRWIPVAYAGAGLWGVCGAIFGVASVTALQRIAPAHARGRVMALSSGVQTFFATAALPVAGAVVGVFAVQSGALLLAAVSIGGGVAGLALGPFARRSEAAHDLPR